MQMMTNETSTNTWGRQWQTCSPALMLCQRKVEQCALRHWTMNVVYVSRGDVIMRAQLQEFRLFQFSMVHAFHTRITVVALLPVRAVISGNEYSHS